MLRPRIRRAFRLAIQRADLTERDVDAEIRFHVDMRVEQLVARGWAPVDAEQEARRRFHPSWDEAVRELRRSGHTREERLAMRERLDILWQDLRYAVRTLVRSARFSASAVLTLALGLGAATVVFSVVDHVVLRPLPFERPDELVVVRERIGEMAHVYPSLPANASHFLEWQRGCGACADMAAMAAAPSTLTSRGDPQRVGAVRASANLFALLGVRPILGRTYDADEDVPGRDAVVVLSETFWRRQFGADPSILGRSITLDGRSLLVVGVLPASFRLPAGQALGGPVGLPREIDAFQPLALTERQRATAGEYNYVVLARLHPSATVDEARAQIRAVQSGIAARARQPIDLGAFVVPMQEQVVGGAGRPMLLLLSAVGAVLLIVCVNLANLTLARNAGRGRESAVRIALGAGAGRIARLALAESLVLAFAGGALGLLLAHWGLRAVVATAPATLPRIEEVQLDGRVLAVAALLSLLVGLGVGALPARRLTRADPAESLRAGGRTATDGRRAGRRRGVFIAAQVALSTVLLVATGLLLSSFVRVLGVDKGFSANRVLVFDVSLPRAAYLQPERRTQFYERALRELAALPGVVGTATTTAVPLEGESQVDMLSVEHDQRPDVERPTANIRHVSPDYFAAVGTPVLRGRPFADSDRGRRVVLLSERAAHALWPGENPIGKFVVPGSNDPIAEVVGIAADVRTSTLEAEGSLVAYVPHWQRAPIELSLLVRTASEPGPLAASARAAVRGIDPSVLVTRVRTMEDVVADAAAMRRFQLALLLIFALMALVTASIGIYGVITQSLASRSGEIGVRLALGAQPADVHRLVLREGLAPVAAGLLAGVAAAMALGQAFRSLLFEVRPADPLTLVAVSALLALVAVVACIVPARRATASGLTTLLRLE
jgi:putative ABC transport system permease protein